MHPPDETSAFAPLHDLSSAGRRLLERGMREVCARPAATLLRKGDCVSGAYLVLAGRLRVYTMTLRGTEATLYFIEPGETCVLALNCLFNDLRYPAWVQADGDARIGIVPGALYRRLFENEPPIQALTVRALSVAVFRLMAELELVHSARHRERLAHFILSNAKSDGMLRMTQQQLAQHLGTTREVVARLLGGFVADGLVATRRGAIGVLDLAGMRRILAAPEGATRDRGNRRTSART